MLEQGSGNPELLREIERAGKKIADGNIESLLTIPVGNQGLHPGVGKLADSIRSTPAQTAQIIKSTFEFCCIGSACVHGDCAGKMIENFVLVSFVFETAVIGKIGEFVSRSDLSENVVGT